MKRFMLVSMVLALLFTAIPVYAVDFCFWTDCKPINAKLALGEKAADVQVFPAEISLYSDYIWRRHSDGGPGWGTGISKTLVGFFKNVLDINFTYVNQIANDQANLYGPTGVIDIIALIDNYIINTGINNGNMTFQLGPGIMFDIDHSLHPAFDVHFNINLALDK